MTPAETFRTRAALVFFHMLAASLLQAEGMLRASGLEASSQIVADIEKARDAIVVVVGHFQEQLDVEPDAT